MATTKSLQRGSSTVEFALVTMLLLILLFGITELGRVFLVWNAAQEVTRRAARNAAVLGFGITPFIQYDAVLNPEATNGTVAFPGIGEITNWTVSIQFMTGAFGSLTTTDSPPFSAVQASLCVPGSDPCQPLSYLPAVIPGINLRLFLPISTVTLPLESAGASSG